MPRLLCLLFLLELTLPGHAQTKSPTPVITLPFDLVRGVMVLRNLAFNGRRGDFILDTGCTYGLLVEQAAFPGQLRPSARQGLSAAGATPLYELPLTRFAFGEAYIWPRTAYATSLAALRAAVGPQLLGLIGTDLLRHYEVVIDYAHRRLSCYPLSSSAARPFTRHDSVAFSLVKGWPLAVGFIDSVPVQLLLDTGARDSQLAADFAQNLPAARAQRGRGAKPS
ncbi:MAG: hypothetical protein ACRYFK_21080 [Janthinobacterium lividum]